MLSIRDLTTGERLIIARRRNDETQQAAAKRLGMPLGPYKLAEKDTPSKSWRVPIPSLDKLQPHEVCRLLRVRKGLTLDDLSRRMGVSKWWICLMEQGKAPTATLLEYWSRR